MKVLSFFCFLGFLVVLANCSQEFQLPQVQLLPRYEQKCAKKKVQVITDVDDTLQASGDTKAAGFDSRWDQGVPYAGVYQFYLELSRGRHEIPNPEGIVIASARPSFLGHSFPKIDEQLAHTARENHVADSWGKVKDILNGRVDDFLSLQEETRFRKYGRTKVEHISEFAAREASGHLCHIFVGDNGQGDHFAGVHLLEAIDVNFASVFIHNVTSHPEVKEPVPDDLFLFSTYPVAALNAYARGFISYNGLVRVVRSAVASSQYTDCVECAQTPEKCKIVNRKPTPFSADGGCTHLFQDLQFVGRLVNENIYIPEHLVDDYEEEKHKHLSKIKSILKIKH